MWARAEDTGVRVGVTDYAQDQLGDVVYVDLPEAGARVEQGQPFGEIESTKTVSDLHAPLSGTVVERNEALGGQPDLVNTNPYDEAWLVVIQPDDPEQLSELLNAEQYDELIAST